MNQKAPEFLGWWFDQALGKPPFTYQEAILRHLGPLVINKARQTGISTTMACMAVSYAALGDKKVLICSNKEDSAKHILEYAEQFIRPLLENGLIEKPIVDEKGMVRWEAGGEIRCFAASPSGARGYPAHLVIFDEYAHFTKEIDMDRRMMEAVAPSIAQAGGRLIILSTPNGTKNEFYRTWDNTPEANRITVHYSECPTLKVHEETMPYGKQYWIEGVPAPFPETSFRQEFCNDFYVGSDEAIPLEALRASIQPSTAVEPTDLRYTSFGVDIGREHDAYAIVIVGQPADGTIWIVEVTELKRTPFDEQEAALEERKTRRNPNRIVMDKTFNPQSTENAHIKWPYLVESFAFTEQSKRDLLSKAGSFFTMGIVRCPLRFRQAIDEIANIRKVIGPSGSVLLKDKPHGDIGWACLLALWGVYPDRSVSDDTMESLYGSGF